MFATALASVIALYDGAQINVAGHPSGMQLALAVATATAVQGWTTSRSGSTVRWFFVALLAATAVMSFAGFTLFAWGVDGAFLMLPLSLVTAAIASWVAGSTHLRILAHERVSHRQRRVPQALRALAGFISGMLLIQAVVIVIGYARFTPALVFPLILIAIALPPLYLAVAGRDLTLKRHIVVR